MTEKERDAVREMVDSYNTDFAMQDELKVRSIKKRFLVQFGTDVRKNPQYLIQLLEAAYREENALDVELALATASMFKLFSKDYSNILLKLIETDWHFVHESIASIFQKLKLPETVDSLHKTALSRFEYLDYDDCFALAVKCIWALGDINTDESFEKLRLLAQSDNEIIRSNAVMQLQLERD